MAQIGPQRFGSVLAEIATSIERSTGTIIRRCISFFNRFAAELTVYLYIFVEFFSLIYAWRTNQILLRKCNARIWQAQKNKLSSMHGLPWRTSYFQDRTAWETKAYANVDHIRCRFVQIDNHSTDWHLLSSSRKRSHFPHDSYSDQYTSGA
jgi:hypothetical protein